MQSIRMGEVGSFQFVLKVESDLNTDMHIANVSIPMAHALCEFIVDVQILTDKVRVLSENDSECKYGGCGSCKNEQK